MIHSLQNSNKQTNKQIKRNIPLKRDAGDEDDVSEEDREDKPEEKLDDFLSILVLSGGDGDEAEPSFRL